MLKLYLTKTYNYQLSVISKNKKFLSCSGLMLNNFYLEFD